jgi:two-component system, response regulator PdtaR
VPRSTVNLAYSATMSSAPTAAVEIASRCARVLAVDDDRVMLEALTRGLRKAGYDVLEATSGEQALRLAIEHRPDLAILDMRMPGMSGLELAGRLRELAPTPFLFASVHDDEEIVRRAAEHGALGYLVKPIDSAQVVPAIEAALARARDIRRLEETEAQLTQALASTRETSIAVGILVERYRVDRQEAFEILREHARAHRRKLADAAEDLLRAAESLNVRRPGTK